MTDDAYELMRDKAEAEYFTHVEGPATHKTPPLPNNFWNNECPF